MFRALLLGLLIVAPAAAHGACETGCERRFPPDSGIVNVRDFGAVGDGQADDTAALRAAIDAAGPDSGPFFWRTRIVWLPNGTYRVSAPLERHYADGRYGSGMILMGESRSGTTIRLADHAPGFSDPRKPRGVVMTTAKLLDGTPTSGGKDYTNKGEGNDAYENFIENLTIDTGRDNPGAIGIDYLANNLGAVRDVRVIGDGVAGIAMPRKWPGPALLQRVSVEGFATGIAVANTEYGVTLDHVSLTGQREAGLANDRNVIAAAHLTISTAGTAIVNSAPEGLIVLANSTLRAAGGTEAALLNRGVIVARDVTFDGIPDPSGAMNAQPVSGVLNAGEWRSPPVRDALNLDDAPPPPEDPVRDWRNVLSFGSPANGPPTLAMDVTDALRLAFASGAATIYLPYGRYTIHASIDVPPTVKRIVGMNASLTVRPEREPGFARTTGMFRVIGTGAPLTIERLAFDMTDLGEQLAVEVVSPRDVVLRDIVTAGTSLLDRKPAGGRVFIEDACCGALRLAGAAPVIARQLDTEGGDTRIVNDGGYLTVLGLKTEGDCTVVENRNGARTNIVGGLLYVVGDADPRIPAFRDAGSGRDASSGRGTGPGRGVNPGRDVGSGRGPGAGRDVSSGGEAIPGRDPNSGGGPGPGHDSGSGLWAAFAEESFRAGSRYSVYFRGAGRDVRAAEFPPRGYGRIVPWLFMGAGTDR